MSNVRLTKYVVLSNSEVRQLMDTGKVTIFRDRELHSRPTYSHGVIVYIKEPWKWREAYVDASTMQVIPARYVHFVNDLECAIKGGYRGAERMPYQACRLWAIVDSVVRGNEHYIFCLRKIENPFPEQPPVPEKPKSAVWSEDSEGSWNCSGCDIRWTFTDKGPKENDVNFCPKCGLPITEYVRHEQEKAEKPDLKEDPCFLCGTQALCPEACVWKQDYMRKVANTNAGVEGYPTHESQGGRY